MKSENFVFAAVLILVVCGMAYVLLPAYADYKQSRREAQELERKLLQVDVRSQEVRQRIHALKTEPAAVERVAREKFGWCRANEKINHFDPPANVNPAEMLQ